MVSKRLGSHFLLLFRHCDFIPFRIFHLLPAYLLMDSLSVFLSPFVWCRLLSHGPLRGVLCASTYHSLWVTKVDPVHRYILTTL